MSRKEVLFGYGAMILAPPIAYVCGGPVATVFAGVLGFGFLVAAYRQKDDSEDTSRGSLFGGFPVSAENSADVPDVALIWDWTEDQKKAGNLLGRTEKSILVDNRSSEYVYNVRVEPVHLQNDLVFDVIPEIAPHSLSAATGRWHSIVVHPARTGHGS